jgi:ankyrin repeat protein
MLRHHCVAVVVLASACGQAYSQGPRKTDFARDVQPLFKAYCIECHGPKQQKNGFRLDRRRDAMKGGTGTMIGPGNSQASRLVLRLTGSRSGPQMPPDGPLSQEEIAVIKAWIDQGATWPDEFSGESAPTPSDPLATRLMEKLREGDRAAFQKMLKETPNIARLKGPGGTTPLMFAVLYGDADAVRVLLENSADPNARNEAGATALMWAVDNLEKTRLLLKSGADVNARSDDGRTPLFIATGRFGSSDVVKLLLDHGADISVKAHSNRGAVTPLTQAAGIGDDAVLRLLIERGGDAKIAGIASLNAAVIAKNHAIVDLMTRSADRKTMSMALLFVVPPRGFADAPTVKSLIKQGADVNARDPAGRTVLMLAASSESVPLETVQTLLDQGADINAKATQGETALDIARRRGQTPLVDLLVKAGAKGVPTTTTPVMKPKPAASVRAALERSIPLLQRADATFSQKAGCVSCHNNSLTAMTIAAARKHGIPVDETVAKQQVKAIASYVENWRERTLQGFGSGGDAETAGFTLVGLAAEGYAPDPATDAWARYLKNRQSREGRWWAPSHRPPLESSEIQVTANALRALQVYAPKTHRAEYEKAVQRAADWLTKAQPRTIEDRSFQILGLAWAGGQMDAIRKAASELLAEQRADGGWGQLPSLASDAYATGQAMVALTEAGTVAATSPAYQRGVQFLMNSQLEDGSWHVRSRCIPFQPHFESGFPHGHDQWISVAATNWATMALVPCCLTK